MVLGAAIFDWRDVDAVFELGEVAHNCGLFSVRSLLVVLLVCVYLKLA